MKKGIKNFALFISVILVSCFVALPVHAYPPESNSSGQANETSKNMPTEADCAVIKCKSQVLFNYGGVRFTFIDNDGNAVSKSYDFLTFAAKSYENMHVNISDDKSKKSGSYTDSIITLNSSSFPALSRFIGKMEEHGAEKSSLSSVAWTGGRECNMDTCPNHQYWANENKWFIGLTNSGNPNAAANVNAFIYALKDMYGDFDADSMILKVTEACHSEEELYIMMEPILTMKIENDYIFGTINDSYRAFNGGPGDLKTRMYRLYYDRDINNHFNGFSTAKIGEQGNLSSKNLLPDYGWGVNLDWITDPGGACGQCEYNNTTGTMTSNDYPVLDKAYALKPDGLNCCSALTQYHNNGTLNANWRAAYEQYCKPDDNPDCCTEDPLQFDFLGQVTNCCEETTHSYLKEYDLDDLFCRHNGLKVDKYFEKCNTDKYKEEDVALNAYCDMYCTERVSIDIPGAITAKSGRYFTLSKTEQGTTSPYVEGFKRCRIRVKYDEWEKDYIKKVREEVEAYNSYQEQMAFVESYKALIDAGKKETVKGIEYSCTAQAKVDDCEDVYEWVKPGDDDEYDKDDLNKDGKIYKKTDTTGGKTDNEQKQSGKCNITYKKHVLDSDLLRGIYRIKIKEDNGSVTAPIVNSHISLELINLGGRIETSNWNSISESIRNDGWVATDIENGCAEITSAEEKKVGSSISTTKCGKATANWSCSYSENITSHYVNLEDIKNQYQKQANIYAEKLKTAATDAKRLENQLTECDNFFTSEQGKPEVMYEFNPTLSFRYSQIYRDDKGQSVLSELPVPFKNDPGCNVTGPFSGNLSYAEGTDTYGDRYSEIYGSGTMNTTDLSGANLQYATGVGSAAFNGMLDTQYAANKKFTHDARYNAVCSWKEEDNNVNTLVPSGAVTETAESNFTIHEREYKVFLTTYQGTFETDWSLTNVGERGKFDDEILRRATNTCSGNPSSSGETFSCTLKVEYEIVYTGKCNGITKNPDDCDPVRDINGLFQFKVVDPRNIFPTGTTTEDGKKIAYNWTDTTQGQQAQAQIQEKGSRDTTYSEENVTYSFHLTPATMRHIKNYNVSRNSNGLGGYSDFNMVCECPTEVQTNTAVNGGVGCTKCKSQLLSDLANGTISYNGGSYRVSAWTATKSIDQVRNNSRWR